MRWGWKRCTYVGSDGNATWTIATREEFDPLPRVCRTILAVYEDDLRNPAFAPTCSYRLNPDWGLKHAHLYDDGSQGWSPEMVKKHALSSLLLVLTGDVATNYAPNQGPHRQPPREADVRRWVRAPQALEGRDLVVEYRVRDSEDALGGEHEEL
nr:Lipase, class 3 [Ipomoea batatas]